MTTLQIWSYWLKVWPLDPGKVVLEDIANTQTVVCGHFMHMHLHPLQSVYVCCRKNEKSEWVNEHWNEDISNSCSMKCLWVSYKVCSSYITISYHQKTVLVWETTQELFHSSHLPWISPWILHGGMDLEPRTSASSNLWLNSSACLSSARKDWWWYNE